MFEKTKKTMSAAFLFSPGAMLARDGIGRAHNFARDAFGQFSTIRNRKYRKETFEESIERQGIDESHLAKRRKELVFVSRVWYGLGGMVLLYSIFMAIEASIMGVIGGLSILLIAAVSGFISAFRAHQIDERNLMSFGDFAKSADGWFK